MYMFLIMQAIFWSEHNFLAAMVSSLSLLRPLKRIQLSRCTVRSLSRPTYVWMIYFCPFLSIGTKRRQLPWRAMFGNLWPLKHYLGIHARKKLPNLLCLLIDSYHFSFPISQEWPSLACWRKLLYVESHLVLKQCYPDLILGTVEPEPVVTCYR